MTANRDNRGSRICTCDTGAFCHWHRQYGRVPGASSAPRLGGAEVYRSDEEAERLQGFQACGGGRRILRKKIEA